MDQPTEMTPEELTAAQHALGLSDNKFAAWIGVSDGSTLRKWKRGDRTIPGPAQVLIRATINSSAVREYFGLTLAA